VYGFQLSGDTTISGDVKPAVSVGRIVLDGAGSLSGYSSVNFGGYFLGNPVTGTYEVRTDCSISWSLQDDSGALQHFGGIVGADAKRVQFSQTDAGAAKRSEHEEAGGTVHVDADCFAQLDLSLPLPHLSAMKFRGILVDSGKEILGIETDPGTAVKIEMAARD
jgi:hypothetical protein